MRQLLAILFTTGWLLAQPVAPPPPAERMFPTADAAAHALIDAVAQNDTVAMLKLFGPGGKDIVASGDPAEDKSARGEFTRRAQEKLEVRVEQANPARATVVVGHDNWPLPVPLLRTKTGEWHFDAARGRTEILARRVGRNELAAIDVCRGYVEAQTEYASHDVNKRGMLEYAQKIVSTPGKKDGLYWEGESGSLVPRAFGSAAYAMAEAGKRIPYHGYYFRILTAQGPDAPGGARSYLVKGEMMGGYALIAWPAEYGVSGIKTLVVGSTGIVYEKDLGVTTAQTARFTTTFNPGKGWHRVEGE